MYHKGYGFKMEIRCVDCNKIEYGCGNCHTENCDSEQLCGKNQPCDYYRQRDRR